MGRGRLERGAAGEKLAERFLKRLGFRLAARNLRRKAGEIDLLMWDGEDLVIVEVRSMRDESSVPAAQRVPASKRRQLLRLARHLLSEFTPPAPTIRFDICLVVFEPEPVVHHLPNAFREDNWAG